MLRLSKHALNTTLRQAQGDRRYEPVIRQCDYHKN